MDLKELSTLIAACIAAIASLASLAIGLLEKRRTELREAQRAALEPHVVALGEAAYSIVATSRRMASSREDARFQRHKERATESAKELDLLRRQVRYTLWGLNDQLHDLVLLPRWIEFLRGDKNGADELLAAATNLRAEVDDVVRACYLDGRAPSLSQCTRVKALGDAMRSCYRARKVQATRTSEVDDDDA